MISPLFESFRTGGTLRIPDNILAGSRHSAVRSNPVDSRKIALRAIATENASLQIGCGGSVRRHKSIPPTACWRRRVMIWRAVFHERRGANDRPHEAYEGPTDNRRTAMLLGFCLRVIPSVRFILRAKWRHHHRDLSEAFFSVSRGGVAVSVESIDSCRKRIFLLVVKCRDNNPTRL